MFLCHGLALGNKVYTNLIKPASSLPTTDIYISKPHVLVTGGLDTLKNKILRWLGREIVVVGPPSLVSALLQVYDVGE